MTAAIILTIEGVRTRASTNEALVTFAVPLEQAALVSGFMSKIGRQVGAAFADVEQGTGAVVQVPVSAPVLARQVRPFGAQAKALKLSGFFRCPLVWQAIGSDEQFLAWIRLQPSAHSDEFSEHVNGEGRCEAAHVSRIANGRGVGHKPEYSAIPLTHAEHALTHAKGESALRPREWFDEQRIKYLERWSWDTLKHKLGFDSMGDIPPNIICHWAIAKDVDKYLPVGYVNQD